MCIILRLLQMNYQKTQIEFDELLRFILNLDNLYFVL